MLERLSEQGVDTVVATPHFYANEESVSDFIARRDRSYKKLSESLKSSHPKVLKGAEVKYYTGIGRLEGLSELCVEGTKLLLLEMNFSRWTEYTVREVVELSSARNFTVILAHVERYLRLQSRNTWERFIEAGVFMQVNASFFNELQTRRKALSMLKKGEIHLIGSDSHNLTSRAPRLGKTFELIHNKLGENFASQIKELGESLLFK